MNKSYNDVEVSQSAISALYKNLVGGMPTRFYRRGSTYFISNVPSITIPNYSQHYDVTQTIF